MDDKIFELYANELGGDVVNDLGITVHTPDPSRYHDPSKVYFGTVPQSRGGVKGVVIPRATPGGGSRAFKHSDPVRKVYIDEYTTGKQFCVDMAKLRQPGAVKRVMEQKAGQYDNMRDLAIATFGAFIEPPTSAHGRSVVSVPAPTDPVVQTVSAPSTPVIAPVPVQTPGLRQIPQATGIKAASFGSKPSSGSTGDSSMPSRNGHSAATLQPSAPPVNLHAYLNQPSSVAILSAPTKPARCVTIQLPDPYGAFHTYYQEVLVSEDSGSLLLVYDHAIQTQSLWIPPTPEDGKPQEPLAVMVTSNEQGKPDMVYLVYPTGQVYRRGTEQQFLLMIDVAKEITKEK